MKKLMAIFIALSFFLLNLGYVTPSHAAAVTQKIPSEAAAKKLAADAGGTYVPGSAAPPLTGTQVALPVVSEETGKVLGYVVADKAALVSALNAAGYSSVASAITATEAGAAAGLAVGAGISTGTIVVGTAILAGIAALAVSSGGGGGGGGSTSNH
jgi:hypothetical protein